MSRSAVVLAAALVLCGCMAPPVAVPASTASPSSVPDPILGRPSVPAMEEPEESASRAFRIALDGYEGDVALRVALGFDDPTECVLGFAAAGNGTEPVRLLAYVEPDKVGGFLYLNTFGSMVRAQRDGQAYGDQLIMPVLDELGFEAPWSQASPELHISPRDHYAINVFAQTTSVQGGVPSFELEMDCDAPMRVQEVLAGRSVESWSDGGPTTGESLVVQTLGRAGEVVVVRDAHWRMALEGDLALVRIFEGFYPGPGAYDDWQAHLAGPVDRTWDDASVPNVAVGIHAVEGPGGRYDLHENRTTVTGRHLFGVAAGVERIEDIAKVAAFFGTPIPSPRR